MPAAAPHAHECLCSAPLHLLCAALRRQCTPGHPRLSSVLSFSLLPLQQQHRRCCALSLRPSTPSSTSSRRPFTHRGCYMAASSANNLPGMVHISDYKDTTPYAPHNPVTDAPASTNAVTLSARDGALVTTACTAAIQQQPKETAASAIEAESCTPCAAAVLTQLQAPAIALTDCARLGQRVAGAEGILAAKANMSVARLEQNRASTMAEVTGQAAAAGAAPRLGDDGQMAPPAGVAPLAEAAPNAAEKEGVVQVPAAGSGKIEIVGAPPRPVQSGHLFRPRRAVPSAERKGPEAGVKAARDHRGTVAAQAAQTNGDTIRAEVADWVEEADTPIVEGDFVTVGGLQFVLPYYYDFRMHAKKRMVGQHPVDLFAAEFPVRDREYYERAYADGRLRVEGSLDEATGGLKPGQCVRHFVHRHEPPVPACVINVLSVSPDFVVVDKPPCTPVHVAGQYRKNTVIGILEASQKDLGTLHPVHRLDKPVSGVLILSRSAAAANSIRQRIVDHTVQKVYVARVQGAFPPGPVTEDAALEWDSSTNLAAVALSAAAPGVKAAVTRFRLLAADATSGTSLVQCEPQTGRTHQIRIHLAHLGHPIANDGTYGGTLGLPRAKWLVRRKGDKGDSGGGSANAAVSPASAPGAVKRLRLDLPIAGEASPGPRADLPSAEAAALAMEVPVEKRSASCQHCPRLAPQGYPLDLQPLWLHAASYSCPDWSFSAPLPAWAADDFEC